MTEKDEILKKLNLSESDEEDMTAFANLMRKGIQVPDDDPVADIIDQAYDQIDREDREAEEKEEKKSGSDCSDTED
jgi:hypothetical protein